MVTVTPKVPFALPGCDRVMTELPALWFARAPGNKPYDVRLHLSERTVRAAVKALAEAVRRQMVSPATVEAVTAAVRVGLSQCVSVTVVRFDGKALQHYEKGPGGEGMMVPVPALEFGMDAGEVAAWARALQRDDDGSLPSAVLTLHVQRAIVLSSSMGNAPLRLACEVAGTVMLSGEFVTLARQPVKTDAPKRQYGLLRAVGGQKGGGGVGVASEGSHGSHGSRGSHGSERTATEGGTTS